MQIYNLLKTRDVSEYTLIDIHDDNGKRVEAKQLWGSPNKKFTIGRK